ncbi:hypothetical protein KC957_01780, partial [Candidatus Saccharibacteria bacterium]|nr:hypothetical protein [Candidatus Saccharibacteria bacterium]
MSERSLALKISGAAAAVGMGAAALIGVEGTPAAALTGASAQLNCAPAYGIDVANTKPPFDGNGDPQFDIFEASTGQSVTVRGGESGTIALGSSASLEDTTVTVKQTDSIYGDIYPDSTATVVLDCVEETTTTTEQP